MSAIKNYLPSIKREIKLIKLLYSYKHAGLTLYLPQMVVTVKEIYYNVYMSWSIVTITISKWKQQLQTVNIFAARALLFDSKSLWQLKYTY